MARASPSDSTLVRLYRNRIADPTTADEARGYWIFVLGIVAGILGILLFLASSPRTGLREASFVLSAAGLVLLIAGPVIRLPLRRTATYLAYLGVAVSGVAIVWFIVSFPANWDPTGGQPTIIGLYALGVIAIAAGGILVPLVSPDVGPGDDSHALLDSRAESEELRGALADTEADEADLAAQIRTLRTSQARYELYQDRSDEWRWRLRHRNGNVIADSSEGYTRRHNAQNGLESVRRNALGAELLVFEAEEALPEAGAEFEPFVEAESRATFEVYEDDAGEYRFRLVHDNGNILADGGEGYASRGNANRAVSRLRALVGPADYLRIDPTAFEVYRDRAGEWRWRLLHRNGQILADSGEGYTRRNDARRAVTRIRDRTDDLEFEVYEDRAGEFRYRVLGRNDQIVADSGEGYDSRDGADEAVERVREYAPEAAVLEIGRAAFEVYEDRAGEFRWRLRHRNGNVLADSGEGYADRSGALDAIESVKANAPNAGDGD